MKLNGVLGEFEPSGTGGPTLPHWSTTIVWPLKWAPVVWSTTFQLPPPAAVGLHPGLTTPPKLKSGRPLVLPMVPPPVSQHDPCGGGDAQKGPLSVKSTLANRLSASTLN